MDLYREQILDHYKNPQNFGQLKGADVVVKETNASCGDEFEFFLKLDAGKIADIKFQGVGCAISMAANSLVSEMVKGKTLQKVKTMTEKDIFKLLGVAVNPGRVRCATLPLRALKKGLEQLKEQA